MEATSWVGLIGVYGLLLCGAFWVGEWLQRRWPEPRESSRERHARRWLR